MWKIQKKALKNLEKIYFRACIFARARVYYLYTGGKVIRSNRKHKTQETAERVKNENVKSRKTETETKFLDQFGKMD